MGREVRMVSAGWEHPKEVRHGRYDFKPMVEGPWEPRVEEWDLGAAKWAEGLRDDFKGGWQPLSTKEATSTYEEWCGERPRQEDYMPSWKPEEKTHYMMYEDTSEGTPISPAFATPEELAQWLVDNEASANGDQTASYEGWLRVSQGGYAPSMILRGGVLRSGVDGL